MIKKEYQLVAIPRSLREFRAGVLVQLKNTKQFGTIRKESLRGKNARRNLRHSFNAITLYLVESNLSSDRLISLKDEVIFTLKDGSKVVGYANDLLGSDIVSVDFIVMNQREIMESWICLPAMQRSKPLPKFADMGPRTLDFILNSGGKVYMEVEAQKEKWESVNRIEAKLLDNHPVIHLEP